MGKDKGKATIHLKHRYSFVLEKKILSCLLSSDMNCIEFLLILIIMIIFIYCVV